MSHKGVVPMDFRDKLTIELIRLKRVKVDLENETISVWNEVDKSLMRREVKHYNLNWAINCQFAKRGECFLEFKGQRIYLYSEPVVTVILAEMLYMGMNSNKAPIFVIDGTKCSGYSAIGQELFDISKTKKELKVLLEAYMKVVEISRNPKIERFFLYSVQKNRGRKGFPIIGYGSSLFTGMKHLRDVLGEWLTKERETKILQHIGWEKVTNKKKRVTNLDKILQTFQPRFVRGIYLWINPEGVMGKMGSIRSSTTKKSLLDYIKEHPQGCKINARLSSQLFEKIHWTSAPLEHPPTQELTSFRIPWINIYQKEATNEVQTPRKKLLSEGRSEADTIEYIQTGRWPKRTDEDS